MFGDYELICHLYGISGASGKLTFYTNSSTHLSGRHCCLFCTITSQQLMIHRANRPNIPLRSLDTLNERHAAFVRAGSNLKKAKFFDNVIGPTFLISL